MALSISKRPCQIGGHINARTETHGDEDVGAIDVTLSKIMLEADELDELLGVGSAQRLFRMEAEPIEPAWRDVGVITIQRKYEKALVQLKLDDEWLKLGGAKLGKIMLIPRTGGLTEMSLQTQCCPEAAQVEIMFKHMGKECDCSIRFGREAVKAKKDQPELPLDHAGTINGSTGEEQPAPVN
jgi:hypothetical protein